MFAVISCPSPRARLQRQSLDVWPAGRWAQYEITFRAWWLTVHRFLDMVFGRKGFLLFFSTTSRPRLQRESLDVWLARRWPQYENMFLLLLVVFASFFERIKHSLKVRPSVFRLRGTLPEKDFLFVLAFVVIPCQSFCQSHYLFASDSSLARKICICLLSSFFLILFFVFFRFLMCVFWTSQVFC